MADAVSSGQPTSGATSGSIDWSDVLQTHHCYGDAPLPSFVDNHSRWRVHPSPAVGVLATVVGPAPPQPTAPPPPPSAAETLATQLDCLPSHVRFTAGRVDGLRQALQALLTWPVEGREVLTTRHEPPAVLAALREWQGPLSYTLRFASWPLGTDSDRDLADAMTAAVGPRTALVVFSQSYPRLLLELSLSVTYPFSTSSCDHHPNVHLRINAKPAAEGGPAGLRHIPVIVDLTDSVGWGADGQAAGSGAAG